MDVDGLASVPIVGARSREQLAENAGAVDLSLSTAHHEGIADAGTDDGGSWPLYGE